MTLSKPYSLPLPGSKFFRSRTVQVGFVAVCVGIVGAIAYRLPLPRQAANDVTTITITIPGEYPELSEMMNGEGIETIHVTDLIKETGASIRATYRDQELGR